MIESRLIVGLSRTKIEEILPFGTDSVGDDIVALNKWAVPHWDEVETVSIVAVKINKTTAETIINRLKLINNNNQKVMMAWLNWGWGIDENLKDWQVIINFYKINYQDKCFMQFVKELND